MSEELSRLFQRVRDYRIVECNLTYAAKVDLLERAIGDSVAELPSDQEVHLGYSGGVDSSLILVKLLQHLDDGVPLVAHTIGVREDLPDIVHARGFVETLKADHPNLKHVVTIMLPLPQDTEESNRILGASRDRPDNYYMLMRAVSPHTDKLVCCDCIDELAGGYYPHRDPKRLPVYDPQKTTVENRAGALKYFMSRLVEVHLSVLAACSSAFGVDVFFPYGAERVMECTSKFRVDELVDDEGRKKPVYAIAKRSGVSIEVLQRRKYGLVNAFE